MSAALPLSFTFHAARRCLERGITEQNVLDTIHLGDPVSGEAERTLFARGRMRVVIADGFLVVTAYRERKATPSGASRRNARPYARCSGV